MIDTLSEYRLPIHGIIINRVVERADSASLMTLLDHQRSYVEELRKMAGERSVALLPLSFTELRGISPLQKIGERLVTELSLS